MCHSDAKNVFRTTMASDTVTVISSIPRVKSSFEVDGMSKIFAPGTPVTVVDPAPKGGPGQAPGKPAAPAEKQS